MVREITPENKREITLMNALVLTDSNLTLEEKGLITLMNFICYGNDQIDVDDLMGYVREDKDEINRIYNSLLEKGY